MINLRLTTRGRAAAWLTSPLVGCGSAALSALYGTVVGIGASSRVAMVRCSVTTNGRTVRGCPSFTARGAITILDAAEGSTMKALAGNEGRHGRDKRPCSRPQVKPSKRQGTIQCSAL